MRFVLRVLVIGASLASLAGASALSGSAATGSGAVSRNAGVPAWIERVQRLVAGVPVSVSVVERGRLIYAHAGNVPRPPASDEKLLLSMALLNRFGARYRIPTAVAGARPIGDRVRGNVWLVGHGDPELDQAALERLAAKLRASGIRSVGGSVVGVTNTFTRERWAPGWRPVALAFIALPTALSFDANSGPAGFVFDPERRAATALTADLRALGVRVRGRARAGREPVAAEKVLAGIRSAPLIDILRRQNLESLNLDAEVLTKMLGAAVFGPPGSIAKGARAIQRWAQAHGAAIVACDRSGLSYTNQISTNELVRLLSAASSLSWGAAMRKSLPRPGEGTLAGRLPGVRVRAKTGTLLQQVSALAGWVWLQQRQRLGRVRDPLARTTEAASDLSRRRNRLDSREAGLTNATRSQPKPSRRLASSTGSDGLAFPREGDPSTCLSHRW
jgi:serine-type D-Ala-D-Ala carboxypeptidase/endopeptidase (penicillin-binding protein 4)